MSNEPNPTNDQPLSLLSWEARGFVRLQSWAGLFTLHARGDEVAAELAPELRKIEWALLRSHTNYDESSPKISASMLWLLVQAFARQEGESLDTFGFEHAAREVNANLAETLGVEALKILQAKNEEQAQKAAQAACSMFSRAMEGMVRSKFPKRARGSGDAFPKEVVAIWTATGLCERLRRLPTKSEVRERLEVIGVTYAVGNSNDVEGKWRDLFGRSGLYRLPE